MEFIPLEEHLTKEEEKKAQEYQPQVNNLMPMKNFFKAQEFMLNVGEFINSPFKTLDCGCIYVELRQGDDYLLWVYISTCPICKLKGSVEEHRNHFNLEY